MNPDGQRTDPDRGQPTLSSEPSGAAALDAFFERSDDPVPLAHIAVADTGSLKAAQVSAMLLALEARISKLTENDQPLALGEALVTRLEERAATVSAQLKESASTFDAESNRIESGMADIARMNDLLAALERRIERFAAQDQPLALSEALTVQLEERASSAKAQLAQSIAAFDTESGRVDSGMQAIARMTELLTALESRMATLTKEDQPLAVGQALMTRLEERAASVSAQLAQGVAAFDAESNRIESGMQAIARMTELLSELEGRLERLTKHDQLFALGEAMVVRLEERVLDATAQLSQSVDAWEVHERTLDARRADATRLTQTVSALEERLSTLNDGDNLRRVETMIGRVEHRAAETAAQLERSARAKDDLQRELARLQNDLQTLTSVARKHRPRHSRSVFSLPSVMQTWRPGAIAGAICMVLVVGLIAARARYTPSNARAAAATAGVSPSGALPPILFSRPLPTALSTLPPAITANGLSLDARSTRVIRAVPAARPLASNRDGVVKPGVPKERPADKTPVTNPAQPAVFAGALAVQSDPGGAAVFVDGQYVGETPVQTNELRAGSHVVRVERDGYRRWTASVLVAANRQTAVTVRLDPEQSR